MLFAIRYHCFQTLSELWHLCEHTYRYLDLHLLLYLSYIENHEFTLICSILCNTTQASFCFFLSIFVPPFSNSEYPQSHHPSYTYLFYQSRCMYQPPISVALSLSEQMLFPVYPGSYTPHWPFPEVILLILSLPYLTTFLPALLPHFQKCETLEDLCASLSWVPLFTVALPHYCLLMVVSTPSRTPSAWNTHSLSLAPLL